MSEQSPVKIQPTQPPPPTSNFSKYLQHFQSINTPIKLPPTFIRNNPSPNNPSSAKFGLAMQMYSSSISTSIIDQIADSPVKEKESGVQMYEDEFQDFVYEPVLANFNPRVKERVAEINRFFARAAIEHGGLHDDANLNGYVRNIISIDLKNAITRHFEQSPMQHPNRSRSKESSKPAVVMPVISSTVIAGVSNETRAQEKQETEANAQTTQAQFAVSGSGKLKKIDLLLIQIMKQKKRKGLVSDYFRAIEMKLVELLEYILQDEPQYFGLSLKEKMKEVLQNLEGFKGKTVDGESKVNMLRIFFEEFRILKKEKDEEMERDNVSKSPTSKKSEQKISGGQKNNEQNKSKRNFDTQSMGGSHPQQKLPPKKKPASKSAKEEDQWMGSLNN